MDAPSETELSLWRLGAGGGFLQTRTIVESLVENMVFHLGLDF